MKTECISTFPRTVMVSGHFNGFHSAHLDYLEQALKCGEDFICVVTSDKQLIMKGGRVDIPEEERAMLVDIFLDGLGCRHSVFINYWDTETTLVAEALRHLIPDIFFRGYDKRLETMPEAERRVCDELGIEIIHAKNRIGERHSSEIFKGGNYDYNKNTI